MTHQRHWLQADTSCPHPSLRATFSRREKGKKPPLPIFCWDDGIEELADAVLSRDANQVDGDGAQVRSPGFRTTPVCDPQ
jgi:hypothetical protein